MKEKEEMTKIYIAEDGCKFYTSEECEAYEKELSNQRKIKYFSYFTNPDLTETGYYYNTNYAAVYIERNYCHKEVLEQYLLNKNNGKRICESVQGYSVQPLFRINEITREAYFKAKPNTWGGRETKTEAIFLSEREFINFPKPIKFLSSFMNYKP